MIASFKEWTERRMLLERNAITMYHGTTTGPNNEKLQAFMNQGIQPMSASGHGQGAGFYLFTNFNTAAEHAKALMVPVNPNNMFGGHVRTQGADTVTGSGHGGAPMVIAIQDVLNPTEYQFDLEVNPQSIMGFLTNYASEINKYMPISVSQKQRQGGVTDEAGGTVYHVAFVAPDAWHRKHKKIWLLYKDPSTLNPIDQQRLQHGLPPSEEPLTRGVDYAEYSPKDGGVYSAQQINAFLQALFEKAPELQQGYNSINRSAQKGLSQGSFGQDGQAIKYIGAEPKQPSQISVFYNNQWTDAQRYLHATQPQPEPELPVDTGEREPVDPNQQSYLPNDKPTGNILAQGRAMQQQNAQPQQGGWFSRWFRKQPQQPQAAMRRI
jgi:hypothetical protein